MKRSLLLTCLLLCAAWPTWAQLSPHTAIAEMGRGINLGNTLEPPFESGWNNGPAQEYYFDDYVEAGFATVRVPVRWDEHTANTPPYMIDPTWMNRVEEVIDWGLERDLYIIVNAHHEEWIKANYDNPDLRDRFDSIWQQIATRFRNKPEKLLFEIINEPFGMTREEVDDLNARILSIIRQTNPTRLVIFSGNQYSGANELITAAVPEDDYLLGYFHSYDPWQFAGQGQGLWADNEREVVSDIFQRVADWSTQTGVPVMISEFGAVRETDYNSRMAFYAHYVSESIQNNIAFQVWDDGGMFRVYRREERTWNDEKDILIHTFPDSPTRMEAEVVGDTLVTLSWEHRTNGHKDILVQRRLVEGDYEDVAVLPKETTSFADTTMPGGHTYRYRIIARFGLGPDRYSYPVEIFAPPTQRSPFLGAPFAIPGTIQAEDFDEGGEGLTYHDTDPQNIPGGYRSNVSVDIEPRNEGGFQVAYIESGEWLEYTIDVQEAGTYQLTTYIASLEGGGRFRFSAGSNQTNILRPPRTNSWQTLEPVVTTMDLEAGIQILRLQLLTARPFNVDRFTFERFSGTANEEPDKTPGFSLYPNPTHDYLHIEGASHGQPQHLALYNMLGQRVRHEEITANGLHRMYVGDLSPGFYMIRLTHTDRRTLQEVFIKQ